MFRTNNDVLDQSFDPRFRRLVSASPLRIISALIAVVSISYVSDAHATYSAPLIEVRIDSDRILHTPSVVRATERRTFDQADVELTGWGAQYIAQFDWSSGLSVLAGVSGGYGEVDGRLGNSQHPSGVTEISTEGFWVGGQLRGSYMLWASSATAAETRRSAVTAFVNLRTLYYDMSDTTGADAADLRFFSLTGGVGLMAEWSVSDYVSICPYAWATPQFFTQVDWRFGDQDFAVNEGFTLRNPFLFGLDIWIYDSPPNWDEHFDISVLGSFVDTDGDDATIAVVIGYTF